MMFRRFTDKFRGEPERAVFFAASAALTAAGALRSRRTEEVVKPLVMLSIQAGLWRSRKARSASDNALLAVATTASLVGDKLMLEEEFAGDRAEADRWIVRGASAFAVNHVAMIALALKLGARPRGIDFVLRAGGLAEGLYLLATRRRHLLAPLGSYSALLASMSATMASPQLGPPAALGVGGMSFLASDATILHRQVFLKDEKQRAAAEAFVLASYCLAQRLLIDGLDARSRRLAAPK
ncbi:MAG: lysoplasmalogenase family protein [Solirubrobacterales bacterium]